MRHERAYEIIVCSDIGESGPENIQSILTSYGSSACEAYEHACDMNSIIPINNGMIAVVKELGGLKPVFVYEILLS